MHDDYSESSNMNQCCCMPLIVDIKLYISVALIYNPTVPHNLLFYYTVTKILCQVSLCPVITNTAGVRIDAMIMLCMEFRQGAVARI